MIAGLGNPGEEYEHTRHNAGFDTVDALADELGVRYWKNEGGALVGKASYRGHELLLVKPQSFMNTSGGPVSKLMRAYGVAPDHLIVVHDELDIEPGTIRVKFGGGHAGHNGLRSICDKLGTRDWFRVRIGIGRPPGRKPVVDWVLSRPRSKDDTEAFDHAVSEGADAVLCLIDNGLEAIMAGHIMLPSYTRAMNPDIKDDDIMPATLSKELLTDLLKGKMGFNGMVLTDASHMVGLTCRMKRSDMIPAAIAAGCDMFLFFNDMDEDFASMMNGYKNGVITDERLDDALHRILALKAHMGLHKKARTELVPPAAEMERVIGCAAHRAMQKEISEHALTLVKYKDADVLPMTPEKYRRIMIVYVTGLEAKGLGGAMKKLMGGGKNAAESLKEKLEAKGFEVTLYESPMDKIQKRIAAGEKVDFNIYFAGKDTIADFVGAQDLIITLVDVAGGFQAVARPGFGMTKGGGEIPWYVFELPVIVIGCQQPTILADIPQARTYINTYDSAPATLDVLVDELMAGPEAFKGKDPIDSFCGMWDTHL